MDMYTSSVEGSCFSLKHNWLGKQPQARN